MSNPLNRDLQLELLSRMQESYPLEVVVNDEYPREEYHRVTVNLACLHEHGLIESRFHVGSHGELIPGIATITAAGMDFIADDGGLSAILGVVTVKLHEDTLKALLIAKIEAADADPSIKASLIDRIKSLPSEALGKLTERVLDAGLDHLPSLPDTLNKLIGS